MSWWQVLLMLWAVEGSGKSWTGLSSGQELDSEIHGLESEAGRQTESFRDADHERREQDPCDPSALS